jgi:hypothetical protein
MAWCEANGVDFLFGLAFVADYNDRRYPSWSRTRF